LEYPVIILGLHPHLLFEGLGYLVGLTATIWVSSRDGDSISPQQRHPLIFAGLIGALLGAKILAWAQHPQTTLLIATEEPSLLLGGKTIVGGLLGGMAGIELAKKAMGVTQRTGDALVLPLVLGMSLGRIGCFLTGLDDSTYGIETGLPWGVDLGDGVSRHPTALYEIVALWVVYAGIRAIANTKIVPSGWQFRTFLMSYLSWRLLVDWIKPADWEFLFLSPIQIACVLGLSWYVTFGVLSDDEWAAAYSSSPEGLAEKWD
tara:strand:+ start:6429 stop:7211 length:783 start_codon:yes stop_codon:yes gene_type:complete